MSKEEFALHTCSDGSHAHMTLAEATALERSGSLLWVAEAKHKRERGAAYVLAYDHVARGHAAARARARMSGKPGMLSAPAVNTGLSNKVGAQLASDVYARKDYALAMLAQIQMRHEAPSAEAG